MSPLLALKRAVASSDLSKLNTETTVSLNLPLPDILLIDEILFTLSKPYAFGVLVGNESAHTTTLF